MWYEPAKTGAQKVLAAKLKAEKIEFVENRQLEGWEVDIYLPAYYLVVEVDGFYHLSLKQQARDLGERRPTASGRIPCFTLHECPNLSGWGQMSSRD